MSAPLATRRGRFGAAFGDVPTLSLFGARALSSALSFAMTFYLARALGSDEFGRYAFVLGFLTFGSVFFDLGYFASGARLLAAASGGEARTYRNAMVVVGAGFSGVFIVLVAGASLVVDEVFKVKIGDLLLATAVLSPAFVLPYMFEQLLKSAGRIHLLALWVVGSKAASVAALAVLALTHALDARSASIASMGGVVAASIVVLAVLRPGLHGVREGVRSMVAEQRRFGRPLYVGKVVHLGSYHSDKLLLAAMHRAADVGWYSLAMALAGGISMFGQSVAAAAFRTFGGRGPISEELLKRNTTGLVAGAVLTVIAGAAVLSVYLGPEYRPVVYLLVPASIATAFQGAYQPYNSWLLANGLGREIRNFLVQVAAVNLVGNVILIAAFGIHGAVAASIMSMVAYWWLARRAYRAAAPVTTAGV